MAWKSRVSTRAAALVEASSRFLKARAWSRRASILAEKSAGRTISRLYSAGSLSTIFSSTVGASILPRK